MFLKPSQKTGGTGGHRDSRTSVLCWDVSPGSLCPSLYRSTGGPQMGNSTQRKVQGSALSITCTITTGGARSWPLNASRRCLIIRFYALYTHSHTHAHTNAHTRTHTHNVIIIIPIILCDYAIFIEIKQLELINIWEKTQNEWRNINMNVLFLAKYSLCSNGSYRILGYNPCMREWWLCGCSDSSVLNERVRVRVRG